MRTIAISNFKGGVGKTTTAVNLAYNLAAIYGKRVLLVDADPQGNSTYFYSKYLDNAITTADVIQGRQTAGKAIRRTRYKGIDIIAAGLGLDRLYGCKDDALKGALAQVSADYDYCIVDCQPSMQRNTLNAITAADDILIPVKPDQYGVNGLEVMLDDIGQFSRDNSDLDLIAAVITMYKPTKSIHSCIEDIGDKYNILVMDSVIRAAEAANTSILRRRPLTAHRSQAGITQDYLDLTKEYLERVGDNAATGHNG